MLTQGAVFLVETVIGLFTLTLLLRFYLQLVRAPFRNPVSQFVCAFTDWLVLPARRLIPGLWGIDLASLVLAWMCELATLAIVLTLRSADLKSSLGAVGVALAVLAAVRIVRLTIYILMVAVIIGAVLTWVNRYSPLLPLLANLTQPFLRPLQKRVPTVGNVDLSPLVLIIILQLILIVPVAWIELTVMRLV